MDAGGGEVSRETLLAELKDGLALSIKAIQEPELSYTNRPEREAFAFGWGQAWLRVSDLARVHLPVKGTIDRAFFVKGVKANCQRTCTTEDCACERAADVAYLLSHEGVP